MNAKKTKTVKAGVVGRASAPAPLATKKRPPASAATKKQPAKSVPAAKRVKLVRTTRSDEPANAFYAQSGGVTAVINATAATCIEALQKNSAVGRIYGGKNGILGALREEFFDVTNMSSARLNRLSHTPGAFFGSCRYKLEDFKNTKSPRREEFQRILEVFKSHNIRYFFYNGGNDSSDTCMKISMAAQQAGYPLRAIHLPKTIDNDLYGTDCSPGYASAAKYLAVSTLETSLDVEAMCESSTKVFLFEVMGRHTGWLAGAAGVATQVIANLPLIILFPEVPFMQKRVLRLVREKVQKFGYVNIIISEGIRDSRGRLVASVDSKDSFGHQQLGGTAYAIAAMVQKEFGYKHHCSVPDYLQRSAAHIVSETDYDHVRALSNKAVRLAVEGKTRLMVAIERLSDSPYRWRVGSVDLTKVANREKKVPASFISSDGYSITDDFVNYLMPLIRRERYPDYRVGLPHYLHRGDAKLVKPVLKKWRD